MDIVQTGTFSSLDILCFLDGRMDECMDGLMYSSKDLHTFKDLVHGIFCLFLSI